MITKALVAFAVLVGGAIAFDFFRQDTGYVLLSYGNTTVETSLWFAVCTLAIGLMLAYVIFVVLRKCIRVVIALVRWFFKSRAERGAKHAQLGMREYLSGNWQLAKKELAAAAKSSQDSLVHYLMAAESAQSMGDYKARDSFLEKADNFDGESGLVQKCRARYQLSSGEYIACENELSALNEIMPNDPSVLNLQSELFLKTENWPSLVDLLPQIKTHARLEKQQVAELELRAYKGILNSGLQNKSVKGHESMIDKLWQRVPKQHRSHRDLITAYLSLLASAEQYAALEELLIYTLNKDWLPELLEHYESLPAGDEEKRLQILERWLKKYPEEPKLLFVCGLIAERLSLWGKARTYYIKSLESSESPKTWDALAKLFDQINEPDKKLEAYKKGLACAMQA